MPRRHRATLHPQRSHGREGQQASASAHAQSHAGKPAENALTSTDDTKRNDLAL